MPVTRSVLHAEAAAHCAAGRLSHAESAYRRLLADDPNDAAALHGLGAVALVAQQPAAALKLLERAARLQPANPDFLDKYGVALAMTGRTAEAVAALREAVRLQPGNVDARFNLGLCLLNARAHEDAIAQFAHVVKKKPRHLTAWLNKGIAHVRVGQLEEARKCLVHARALAPGNTEVRVNYANVLKEMGEPEKAVSEYRAVVEREPGNILALYNLGVTLNDLGRSDEALEVYHRVLALAPDHLDAHNNLGVIELNRNRPEEALIHFDRVLADKPDEVAVLRNKATALYELDRPTEALSILNTSAARASEDVATAAIRAMAIMALGDHDRADAAFAEVLARAPAEPISLYGRALCKLRRREFAEGFTLFEHRWGRHASGWFKRSFSIPEWTGPDQPGPLLVWMEQGIGDQILFAGVLPHLADRRIRFTYECDERLVPLLRRSFPNFAFTPPLGQNAPEIGEFAAQVPAGSLMHRLGLWPADADPRARYLESDTQRRQSLDGQLAALGQAPRIGISWRSTRRFAGTHKSMPLSIWHPILADRDAVFVNLQYGETDDEIAAAWAATGALIHTEPSVDRFADIDGLAALIDSLDLVITTSNLTAHIAGALGKECWLALQHVPLWYWAIDGDVPHIYASIRTFRQKKVGEWAPVVADIAAALTTRLVSDA